MPIPVPIPILAQNDASIFLSVSFPETYSPHTLIISTQNIVDLARDNGETEVLGLGCRVLAEIVLNCLRDDNSKAPLELTISTFEEAVGFLELEFAQDLLASCYYWLSVLCSYAGDYRKEIKYNVKRLRSLLLLRQTPEHEHVKSCLRMIARRLPVLGTTPDIVQETRREVARLGFRFPEEV